jgi:cysteine synthase
MVSEADRIQAARAVLSSVEQTPRRAGGQPDAMSAGVFQDIAQAQALPRVVRLGGNLFAAAFTLMKLVPAQYILRKAAARGDLGPDTVIVETTSGTFGLGLAMQATLLGRRFVLVTDPVLDANLRRRLTDLGVRIVVCDRPAEVGGYQEARLRRVDEIRTEYPDTFCPEQYANPDNPAAYAVVADYLREAIGTIDCVVGPVGSGGSMCGTVRALRSESRHVVAVGVDTHRSMLFGPPDGPRALRGLGNSLMPANLDHSVFDQVHWCTAAEAYAATRELHRTHALFQGPTSGAAFLAARWWARRHPDARCVVLLPDEGYRYLESVYDDAWISRHGFARPLPAAPAETGLPPVDGDRWTWMRWDRRSYREVLGHGPPVRRAAPEPTR